MAAYAALVSLTQIIYQIQHHRPHPPISLENEQIESLTKTINFFLEFLECYTSHIGYSKEADGLENRIADSAYAAEDIIESQIVDQILVGSTSQSRKRISTVEFYQALQKVMEEMNLIMKDLIPIKEKMVVRNKLPRSSTSSAPTGQNSITVGLDDVVYEMTDKLAGGKLDLQIIPILGMGGIGKTTLARTVYAKPVIKHYFDICSWATVSQQYNTKDILSQLLNQDSRKGRGDLSDISEAELGEMLYKHLWGRRYLIVMDDIWNIEAWDRIKFFFPDYKNGSRIVVTTRLSNLASQLTGYNGLQMRFLDEFDSWTLFSKTVLGEESCPELEEIGKKIVENCRGLPLSIAVIGGFLAKSEHTRESWKYVEENLSTVVNSDDNESCLRILHMSYSQLPVYLKPCFLYMGVFEEDDVIRVSTLVKLWVAEGFIKPGSGGRSSEVVAKEYLKDLIDRNLVLVDELGCTGNIKFCKIHDLLRDLCLREAQKQRFYDVIRSPNLEEGTITQRRIVIPNRPSLEKNVCDQLQSSSLVRSLICDNEGVTQLPSFHLLRILKVYDRDSGELQNRRSLENTFQFVNSRYLAVRACLGSIFPSSVYLLWNLQTLIVYSYHDSPLTVPTDIWKMHQLRHVEFSDGIYLPDPPDDNNIIVLGNLLTLSLVINFKCGEEAVKRVPNIKKLCIEYTEVEGRSSYFLNNLHSLDKLESVSCRSCSGPPPSGADFVLSLTFPRSLRKLKLMFMHAQWEGMLEKIGALPLLEKLALMYGSFRTRKWETIGGQFPNLKFLEIYACDDLECWTTESSHFPRLQCLNLQGLKELEEIPSDIGKIATLQLIELGYCRDSVVISANKILEEQEELGEVDLLVRVSLKGKGMNQVVENLASPNFQIEYD